MLPLVQLALSRLLEGRETNGGDTVLPLRFTRSLGGLKGIVDEAGETALAKLGEAERARLPPRCSAASAHDSDARRERADHPRGAARRSRAGRAGAQRWSTRWSRRGC